MSFGEGDLHEQVERLKALNGELCAEVNAKDEELKWCLNAAGYVSMADFKADYPDSCLGIILQAEMAGMRSHIEELEEERRMWLDGWAVNRLTELESLVRDVYGAWCFECNPWADDFACAHFDGSECGIRRRMAALGLLEGGE